MNENKIYRARSKAEQCRLNLTHVANKKPMSGPGNREVHPFIFQYFSYCDFILCVFFTAAFVRINVFIITASSSLFRPWLELRRTLVELSKLLRCRRNERSTSSQTLVDDRCNTP